MVGIDRSIKRLFVAALLLGRYGTVHPTRVRLARSPRWIHLDPADHRAWRMIAGKAVRGICPRNQRFWRHACGALQPSLALDVGANFGECVFSAEYAPGALVFAFEPNASIAPFLARSRAEHPQAEQIHLVHALVGDVAGVETEFFVDRESSGSSSAIAPTADADAGRYERRVVPTVTVDAVVAEQRPGPVRSCVFKIDVEGYEPQVLAGMQRTLAGAGEALGLIEFDSRFIERAGRAASDVLDELCGRFDVWAFRRDDTLVAMSAGGYERLRAALRKEQVHTDLLLLQAAADSPARRLVQSWQQRGLPRLDAVAAIG